MRRYQPIIPPVGPLSESFRDLLPGHRSDERAAHILVVDDLPANTRVLEELLTSDGYRVTTAENGEDALAAVAKERPDLVLLDILMPKIEGYEVCRRLKNDPATRLIPVVLVTGLTDTDSRIRGLEVGADDFMSKPFIVPEMRARCVIVAYQTIYGRARLGGVGDSEPRDDHRSARPRD